MKDDDIVNFLEETKGVMSEHYIKASEVVFVGSFASGISCSWRRFREIAADLYYDSGYGTEQIAYDLKIVFSDGRYMQRGGHDGKEWWEVCGVPKDIKKSDVRMTKVHDRYGGSLRTINEK